MPVAWTWGRGVIGVPWEGVENRSLEALNREWEITIIT
jgi:hypothetical protein